MKVKKKISVWTVVLKILLLLSTVIWAFGMNFLTGTGFLYNVSQHGSSDGAYHFMQIYGIIFAVASLMMTIATVICFFHKNVLAMILSGIGTASSMFTLYLTCNLADEYAWSRDMEPVSSMYIGRIAPTAVYFIIIMVICITDYISYDQKEKRLNRKKAKIAKINAPAPKILSK